MITFGKHDERGQSLLTCSLGGIVETWFHLSHNDPEIFNGPLHSDKLTLVASIGKIRFGRAAWQVAIDDKNVFAEAKELCPITM